MIIICNNCVEVADRLKNMFVFCVLLDLSDGLKSLHFAFRHGIGIHGNTQRIHLLPMLS